MKYKITQQYAQDSEKLIAEFEALHDVHFFIERKLIADNEKHAKLIYRLFDDQTLIKEFNIEKIHTTILPGEYAEGDKYLPDTFGDYKLSNSNVLSLAHAAFVELHDAELFVEDKLTHSTTLTTYYLFHKDMMIAELNQYVKKRIN